MVEFENSDELAGKIILIDDEFTVLSALKLLMETVGYRITEYSDPRVAVSEISDNLDHNLIICDLRMPHLDGLEVLSRIKSLHPDFPFILMSGHATDEDVKEAEALGSNGFLSKPFTPRELQTVLANVSRPNPHPSCLVSNLQK